MGIPFHPKSAPDNKDKNVAIGKDNEVAKIYIKINKDIEKKKFSLESIFIDKNKSSIFLRKSNDPSNNKKNNIIKIINAKKYKNLEFIIGLYLKKFKIFKTISLFMI